MNNNPRIEDGKLMGVSIKEYFSVMLSDEEKPSIAPTVNFDYMPIGVMAKLVHEALKVRGRVAMKKLTVEKLKKTYSGEISWRVLYSKEGAEVHKQSLAMTDDEKAAMIAKLQAELAGPQDDFDKALEDAEEDAKDENENENNNQ